MRMETNLHVEGGSVRAERESVVDAVHHALADRYRRFVLADLATHFHPVPVYDLADRAATELDPGLASADAYRSVRVALAHDHLPVLESAGLIQNVGGRVELTAEGVDVARLSRSCTDFLTADADDR